MRQTSFTLMLIISGLAGFTGYCAALIDWIQDFHAGIYALNPLEGFLETTGLSLYTALGLRFLKLKRPLS